MTGEPNSKRRKLQVAERVVVEPTFGQGKAAGWQRNAQQQQQSRVPGIHSSDSSTTSSSLSDGNKNQPSKNAGAGAFETQRDATTSDASDTTMASPQILNKSRINGPSQLHDHQSALSEPSQINWSSASNDAPHNTVYSRPLRIRMSSSDTVPTVNRGDIIALEGYRDGERDFHQIWPSFLRPMIFWNQKKIDFDLDLSRRLID